MAADRFLFDADAARRIETQLAESGSLGDAAPDLRAALAGLHGPEGPLFETELDDTAASARVIATSAWLNLGLAFSLWSHRMVLEYLAAAESSRSDAERERFARLELIGSTALASGMAHHVMGAPLPIVARRSGGRLQLDGRISWASNLFARDFVLVVAVELLGEGPILVAIPGNTAGLSIDPFPVLLELDPTRSSSLRLSSVELPETAVLAIDFERFIARVRPRFLLLQSSFCWGLAARALHEAAPAVTRGVNEVFAPEHRALDDESTRIETALVRGLRAVETDTAASIRELVQLRLDVALLAGAATRLESKVSGGRGFVAQSATARRLREAAFLPIQSPTEGQLRWELSRYG